MKKTRIAWIDTARGICIFLVVLGHTILPHSWLVYVFSFHMPFFFFLSGYLYNPEKYPDWLTFTKQKIRTILWPYLTFFTLNYIYWLFYFNSKDYFAPIWQMLYSSNRLSAPFIPLWFLTCLFLVEIIFYFLQKKLKGIQLPLIISALAIIGFAIANRFIAMVWSLDIALIALLFYYLGFVFKTVNPTINFLKLRWIGLIGIGLLIFDFILAHYNNYQFSMIYRAYNRDWVFILTSISGTLGYLIWAKILKQTVFARTKIWEFLGQNSLIILGLHEIAYYYVSDFFHYQLHIFPQISIIYAFIFTVLTLVLLTPIIYLINANLPFLVGRFKVKTN